MPGEAQLPYLFRSPLARYDRWCSVQLTLNDRPLHCYDAVTNFHFGVILFGKVSSVFFFGSSLITSRLSSDKRIDLFSRHPTLLRQSQLKTNRTF